MVVAYRQFWICGRESVFIAVSADGNFVRVAVIEATNF